jgi:hypothetical protein
MTEATVEVDHDRKWVAWQAHNAVADRKSATQVRIVFGVVALGIGVRLAMQLLAR